MIAVAEMTAIELAGHVGDHLGKRSINVVLSGGTCVAHYSSGRYVTMDLGFVVVGFARRDRIVAAMAEIGFHEDNRYFRHPDTEYVIEFPPGPLGVGADVVGEIIEIKTGAGAFKIISPTDCVKDRLAGYYHWDDLPCLEQAVLVAQQNHIDLAEIERWSTSEEKERTFQQIRERLRKKS